MVEINYDTMDIRMHRGDTAAWYVGAEKDSGDDWGEHDRMIFTVVSADGEAVLQRYYRLDSGRTSVDLPDGIVLIELHNGDTDQLQNGSYGMELRFVANAVWDGTEATDDMVDVSTIEGRITDGVPVRTEIQSALELRGVYGEV